MGKDHLPRNDIGLFLKKYGLSQYEEAMRKEGADFVNDFTIASNSDISELCRMVKMKLFHQVKFRNAIKSLGEKSEKRKKIVEALERPENEPDRVDLKSSLISLGYLAPDQEIPDIHSFEAESIRQECLLYGRKNPASNLKQYQLTVNRAALLLCMLQPKLIPGRVGPNGEVATHGELRVEAERVVENSNYNFMRWRNKQKNKTTKWAEKREVEASKLQHLNDQIQKLTEVYEINNERIGLSNIQEDVGTVTEISAENEIVKMKICKLKQEYQKIRIRLKKNLCYERRKAKLGFVSDDSFLENGGGAGQGGSQNISLQSPSNLAHLSQSSHHSSLQQQQQQPEQDSSSLHFSDYEISTNFSSNFSSSSHPTSSTCSTLLQQSMKNSHASSFHS
eukprot:Sdes_comp20302_c0_seq2m13919